MATLTWLGHSAFRIESDHGKRVYIDPFLTGNPKTPEDEREPERVDVIAITHGHGDHVGDAVELSQKFPDAEIVCQVELKKWLGEAGRERRRDAGPEQGRHAAGRRPLLHAHERASTPRSNDETGEYLGEPCGIVIRLEDGVPVYFAGDTCVFGDMQLIAHLYEPQLAVLPIGDHFTMGPHRGRARARPARPARAACPCHWGTFPLLTGTPAALAALAEKSIVEELEPGDTIEI